ncbi:hypothetical protein N665_0383s0016 [Sinapis alba]|nr:hypothetical protein N665_0383s0016 [Sinapis alba]
MSSSSCVSGNYYRRHLNAERRMPKQCWCVFVEEVEDIKSVISGMNKDISELRLNVARLEKEIEELKMESERKGDKCMSQGRFLRNVVVSGVGMAILCYYYFFA